MKLYISCDIGFYSLKSGNIGRFSLQKSFVWVEQDFFLLQSGEICKKKTLFETQDLDWNQWVRLSSKIEVWYSTKKNPWRRSYQLQSKKKAKI
jgi:hypothetical protein